MRDRTDLGPVLSVKSTPYFPEYLNLFKANGEVREPWDKEAPVAFRFGLTDAGYKAAGIEIGQPIRRLTIEFDATVAGEPIMTLVYLRDRDLKEWEADNEEER